MALAEQSFFFFIPTVSILGVGCSKEAGPKAKSAWASKKLCL
jgi:alcohol dehydrogenase